MVGNLVKLTVYKKAFKLAMDIFETSKSFPMMEHPENYRRKTN